MAGYTPWKCPECGITYRLPAERKAPSRCKGCADATAFEKDIAKAPPVAIEMERDVVLDDRYLAALDDDDPAPVRSTWKPGKSAPAANSTTEFFRVLFFVTLLGGMVYVVMQLGANDAIAALGDLFGSVGVLAVVAVLYFVPTAIAVMREHRNAPAIIALNVFLGWTFLGWVVALVWALAK